MNRRILAILAALALVAQAPAAASAEITVTDFDDSIDDTNGSCTLREAIRSANADAAVDACGAGDGSDTILLAAGTYTLELVNGTDEDASLDGDLDVTSELLIRGISPAYTVIDGVSGESKERVLHILGSQEAIIRALRVTGGNADGGDGGNIRVDNTGQTNLIDVVVDGGQANRGGGLYVAGGANVDLVRSRIEDNVATAEGGGAYATGDNFRISDSRIARNVAAAGGGIASPASGEGVEIERSSLTGNEAISGNGGGMLVDALSLRYSRVEHNRAISGGGIAVTGGRLNEILHSALVANEASAQGGGLYSDADTVFVRHGTLAMNTAPAGAGGGAYSNGGSTLFDATTIAENTGGGVLNDAGAFFEASLLAANEGGNCLGQVPGAGTFNLDDGNTCQFPTGGTEPNFIDTDPMLGPLTDNGGATPTYALLEGSPAIDAINSDSMGQVNCQGDLDQRGFPRGYPPVIGMSVVTHFCDIGAFERHPPHVVNSTADAVDRDTDDGRCETETAGECTLRAAVMQANATLGLEEIELAAGSYLLGLSGAGEDGATSGDLDLLDPVEIRGAGALDTVVDGNLLDRVFDVRPVSLMKPLRLVAPPTVTFRDLAIANGLGGVRVGDPVRLERVLIRDNTASTSGGGILCAPGCALTIVDSRIVANTATIGGAVATPNGVRDDDDERDNRPVIIERSELSGNVATENAGALALVDLTLRNSTVSGNEARHTGMSMLTGGGIRVRFVVIENSTIANNKTELELGALYVRKAGVLANSIIAGNDAPAGQPAQNCSYESEDVFTSAGGNLSDSRAVDCNLAAPADLAETDPLLAPLADNGGLTRTHALEPGSPAIDFGSDSRCPMLDQRGNLRPDDGDGDGIAGCDSGALEVLSINVALAVVDAPDPVNVNDDVTYTATVTNEGPGDAGSVTLGTTLPDGLAFVSADAGNASCTESSGTVDCALGDIAAAESREISVVATALEAGSVEVPVTVTAARSEAELDDNTVTVTTTVNAANADGGGSGSGGSSGGGSFGAWLIFSLLLLACAQTPLAPPPCRSAHRARPAVQTRPKNGQFDRCAPRPAAVPFHSQPH